MKKVVIETSDDFHREIKRYCLDCGITMQLFVTELIEKEFEESSSGIGRFNPKIYANKNSV